MLQKLKDQVPWPWARGLWAVLAAATVAAGLFASNATADSTSSDAVDIADIPLGILGDQTKPNVMLLLDTSDSMKWSHMPDGWERRETKHFPVGYKSALCNALYYNPDTNYPLPKQSDGTTDMPVPMFSAAWKDGYDQSQGVVNLGTAFQAYEIGTRARDLYSDLPQRAYYFRWTPASSTYPTVPSWDREATCTWPTVSSLFDDDGSVQDSGIVAQPIDGVPGGEMRGRWTRVKIANAAAQERNFAIWYSYYRTRINMAKSSVSLAFGTLNDNFRIGFMTVAKPGSGAHSHFLPVKDFWGTDKQTWFQTIQSAKTGGSSPTREALARVGRYYAGKSDSINDTMLPFVDPVISACQRHYTIVTTDGYWNTGQETKGRGPVQIDGVTLVGQQDGPPLGLTPPEGLIPRPIYDGSVSGYRLAHDAEVDYALASCTLGWRVTVPGGGTKTETTYKKIVKKDVLRTSWFTAELHWWRKIRSQMMRVSHKAPSSGNGDFLQSESKYWYAQGTHTQTKNLYQQRLSWNYVNKVQYRNKLVTTWSTETQTPWARAVAQQVREKRYFYWYKNPALGEVELKTTDRSVCEAFASGCTVEPPGGDSWKVVQSCTAGVAGDYRVECDGPTERSVSASFCSSNGQYVPGEGTIVCQGVAVPPYSGPVLACNSLHPQLAADIAAAGGSTSQVEYSNCDRSHREERYVSQDQCVNLPATQANGFRSTTCTREPLNGADGETDNSCQVTSAPVWDAASSTFTECKKRGDAEMVASCQAGNLPNQPGRMDIVCETRVRVSSTTVAPSTCHAGVEANYAVECTNAQSSWGDPVQKDSASCRTLPTPSHDLTCARRETPWRGVESCTPEIPWAGNGWVGTECYGPEKLPPQPSLCTPAPGMADTQPPPPMPVDPANCSPQLATPENGCIYSTCEARALPAENVASCRSESPRSPDWITSSCLALYERGWTVPRCDGMFDDYRTIRNCQARSRERNMPYGTCEAYLSENPSTETQICESVDESTPEGVIYLQSEAEFAACVAGTDGNGVETQCVQEGPTTIDVPQGELCVPGYNPTTHKVTDCSGVGVGSTTIEPTKPDHCPPETCEEAKGSKKVFNGDYRTNRITLTGTAETGRILVRPPGIVPFNGDLESPAICYPHEPAPQLPPAGRPQPGTAPWAALPATHTRCGSLPCNEDHLNPATGGSSNSLADVAQYYYATDLRPGDENSTPRGWPNQVRPVGTGAEDDKATWQHMSTYVIGMGVSGTLKYHKDYKTGAGDFADLRSGLKTWPIWPREGANEESPESIDDFWHTAVNGRGLYFSANDPSAIQSGLAEVFADIRAALGSGGSVGVSSPITEAGNNFAYAATYRTGRWSGDLQAFEIGLSSGWRTQIEGWSAKDALDRRDLATDNRRILFMNAGRLAEFTYANLGSLRSHFEASAISTRLAQYAQMSDAQKEAAEGANLVNYLRGDRSLEDFALGDERKLYRPRESRLGDIIGSQPLYVGKPTRRYRDAGYAAYRLSQQNRRPMVYVGGNDGMLHAFHADTDLRKTETIGGRTVPVAAREAWAFVPTAVMPEMARLASVDYDSAHRYFVDGSPVVADIHDGSAWKTILVGGFNKGGKGYYALDITNPLEPQPLWEASLPEMGLSFGRPIISKHPNGTWAVFLTSGYNNADGKNHVFVLNASTGATIAQMTTPNGSGLREINNYLRDPAGDNTTRLLYGGDLDGNVWRFQWDVAASRFQVQRVVQLTDQPITTRIELVQGSTQLPRILVATGRLFGSADMTDKSQQSIYGFDDKPEGYAISAASFRADLKESILEAYRDTEGKLVRRLRCASRDHAVCNDRRKGWYVDLPIERERVNVNMLLAGTTLVVASNVPSDAPCLAGGSGWLNYLNFETGMAVNGNPEGGAAGEQVPDTMIVGNALTANRDGTVTSHIQTGVVGKPIDIVIPVATPKPQGKRISWREAVTN
ncbi:pilus assembly protein [Comamonas koreensis]|uniref:PilY1 beta-propeller domain-containing protein n=1 Tax=Comamonas koreensis TaxID=160825 RepID=A0AAW4XVR4_9BURK|nr:PilC/PilY family type IV pilus protein [Comamonas koreensis]MCD2165512.1 hypothetical protein [Comamonas koreensis]